MTIREGDIYLYETENGGDITIRNGEPVMDAGLESAVYISIFGHESVTWWANEFLKKNERLECKFYPYIKGVGKTINTLNKAKELLKLDLKWLISEKIADRIIIDLYSISVTHVSVDINILKDARTVLKTKYGVNWLYQQTAPASGRI